MPNSCFPEAHEHQTKPVKSATAVAAGVPKAAVAAATRPGRFFSVDPQSWINLQKNYELKCAEVEIGGKLAAIQSIKITA